jgi:hypothetical protein
MPDTLESQLVDYAHRLDDRVGAYLPRVAPIRQSPLRPRSTRVLVGAVAACVALVIAGLIVIRNRSTSSVATATPLALCRTTPATSPIPAAVPYDNPVPWVRQDTGWFFDSTLAVSLPSDSVLPSLRQEGQLRTKFPFWRLVAGALSISAQPVSGGPAITEDAPGGYGDSGFIPAGLIFTHSGCWAITGQLNGQSLTFRVWVCETTTFGSTVSTAERRACGAI